MTQLDDFLCGYAQAMLWVNAYNADTGELLEDATYAYISPGKWWEDVPGLDLSDAHAFFDWPENYAAMLATGQRDFSQHGHDFALTRNRHGAGFWDRGYGKVGDILTDAAHSYGEAEVYLVWED